jgi:predicted dehydrogenase
MRIRVGLIGLGDAWQVRYAAALRALADRFEVRAICDQVRHRAEQAAEEFQAEAVDGYQVLARREDIDAILVLSPHWYGELPILAACDSGKAVYCAAGLDLAPDASEHIKQRVEESGIAFVAEFARRQAASTIRLRELIASQLGRPRLLFCHHRSLAAQPSTVGLGGHTAPVAARYLIEQIDWCRYVVNQPPTAVTGILHQKDEASGEDYQMMSLDFSSKDKPGSGAIAQISYGRYIPQGWEEAVNYRPLPALQVSCERGIAFIDLPATVVWFDEAGRHQESLESERPIGEQLLTHFYRQVTSLVRHTSDLEDAYQAIRILQAARRSHQEGRRIEL